MKKEVIRLMNKAAEELEKAERLLSGKKESEDIYVIIGDLASDIHGNVECIEDGDYEVH